MSAEQIFNKIKKYSTFGDYGKAELLKMPAEPNQRKEKFEKEVCPPNLPFGLFSADDMLNEMPTCQNPSLQNETLN